MHEIPIGSLPFQRPSWVRYLPAPDIPVGTVINLFRGSLAIASSGVGARFTASGVDYFTRGNQWGYRSVHGV